MSAMSIAQLWDVIDEWYATRGASLQLNPPASAEAIDALAAHLGVTLPDQLRESLSRHDGTPEGGWPRGELLSCARIADETTGWRDLVSGGELGDRAPSDPAPQMAPVWWHQGWLSLDSDGAGNGAVLDLAPGTGGAVGQILDMDHEVGPSGPRQPDLAAYLQAVLDELAGFTTLDGALIRADESSP